jgi:hypothetical protein
MLLVRSKSAVNGIARHSNRRVENARVNGSSSSFLNQLWTWPHYYSDDNCLQIKVIGRQIKPLPSLCTHVCTHTHMYVCTCMRRNTLSTYGILYLLVPKTMLKMYVDWKCYKHLWYLKIRQEKIALVRNIVCMAKLTTINDFR